MTEMYAERAARGEVFRTLASALWRFRWRALGALMLLLVAKLLMVAVPVVLKFIVDSFDASGAPVVLPVFLLVGYALLRFAGGLFTELRDMVFVRVVQTTVADFNVRLFQHLHKLGPRFHASRQTGVLSRDVSRGTLGLAFLLGTALFTLLPTLVEIISVVVILVLGYHLGFALIVAFTFVLYGVVTVVLTRRRMRLQRRLNDLDSVASGQLVDSMLNYETVKFYTGERAEVRRLRQTLSEWLDVGIDNQRALSTMHVTQSAVIALGVAGVMLLAGQEVVSGAMTVGDLVLVNAYIIQICLPLNALGQVFRQTKEALVNAEKAAVLLRTPPDHDDELQMLPDLHLTRGDIRFEGVSFGYEPGRQVLWDVNLHIPAGATLAVVGGSGSGKSTLARLLFRFYDPNEGRITIDGQDIRDVSLTSVRRTLGMVPQDTVLFNESIAYNIAYGRRGAPIADVIDAARGARVHDFIQSLPAQYDTQVGERGVKLSGGERQRLAIARALLKNPPIIVFDEATSALDIRTERDIQSELDRMSQGRTTLVIAHRLSTVVDADEIVVLEHGRIVERGTHKSLLSAKGLYAQMWQLQRQQDELEAAGALSALRPINLVTLIAGIVDGVRPAIEARNINLYSRLALEHARVMAEAGSLQKMLWDLIVHAIAVTPPGGRVELSLTRVDRPVAAVPEGAESQPTRQMARFAVTEGHPDADSATPVEPLPMVLEGIGVTPLDPTDLAFAIELSGGRFGAEPATVECGVTRWIELPLRLASVGGAPANGSLPVALNGLRVAIVDEPSPQRDTMRDQLLQANAVVSLFDSGESMLQGLEDRPVSDWPQVLICDVALGDMDGYAVVTMVRSLEADRGVPLGERMAAVALSRHAPDEGRLRALLAGFQAHVAKPVDVTELMRRVAGFLPRQVSS